MNCCLGPLTVHPSCIHTNTHVAPHRHRYARVHWLQHLRTIGANSSISTPRQSSCSIVTKSSFSAFSLVYSAPLDSTMLTLFWRSHLYTWRLCERRRQTSHARDGQPRTSCISAPNSQCHDHQAPPPPPQLAQSRTCRCPPRSFRTLAVAKSQQRPAHGTAKANAHTFKCHSLSSSGTTEVTPSSSNLIFKLNVGIVGMGRQQEARRRKRQEGGARSAVLTWQRKLSIVLNLSTCYVGAERFLPLPPYFDSEPCRSRCIMLSTLALSLTFT